MAASSLPMLDLNFLSLQTTSRHRLFLSKHSLWKNTSRGANPRCNFGLRVRIRAVKEEGVMAEEKREPELMGDLNGLEFNGNGSTNGSSTSGSSVNGSYGVNGSMEGYENGSLVKYVNGNGVAVEVVEDVDEEAEKLKKEDQRKKKVEEIGKEDAWFKQSGQGQDVEVVVLNV